MRKYKLTYSNDLQLDLGMDIEETEHKSFNKLIDYIDGKTYKNYNVFVVFYSGHDELETEDLEESPKFYITRYGIEVQLFIKANKGIDNWNVFEFNNYKDAFEYCLDLCETSSVSGI